jgi:FMN phosphatase YigB (HAD superfamily)
VTNGMTDNQRGKIQRTGLGLLVDAWCISDKVGIRKPDPRIFRRTIELCGRRTERGGWMIGDDLALDIAGGHNAGLRTIWLRTAQSTSAPGEPAPDFTVTSAVHAVDLLLSGA